MKLSCREKVIKLERRIEILEAKFKLIITTMKGMRHDRKKRN